MASSADRTLRGSIAAWDLQVYLAGMSQDEKVPGGYKQAQSRLAEHSVLTVVLAVAKAAGCGTRQEHPKVEEASGPTIP